jgi:hypothetical protein
MSRQRKRAENVRKVEKATVQNIFSLYTINFEKYNLFIPSLDIEGKKEQY